MRELLSQYTGANAQRIGFEKYEEIEKKLKTPQPAPAKVKSVLSIIDDSDDEGDEEESAPIKAKSHKIMKAIECDFID